uniref:Uncharacterized protein n=1 Tax=Panagrolaimus sp. ES5 TaxID=591445 RepID=A0AC34FUH9_9BILA
MVLNLLFLPVLLLGFFATIHCDEYVKSSDLEKLDTAPNFKKFILNETNSHKAIWYADMSVNDAYTVCAESGILQIYIDFVWDYSDYYLAQFQLYDSDILQNPVNGPEWWADSVPAIWIDNVTVNSNQNYIFKSALNDNFLFSLSASDASLWQSFGMYTQILSITVPKSAEIEIQFSPTKRNVINNADIDIQKGIMASDSYCGVLPYSVTVPYTSNIPSRLITLILKAFDKRVPIIINTNDGSFELKNTTTTIQTNYFSLVYHETTPKSNGFLIEYTIQKQGTMTPSTPKFPETTSVACRDTDSGCGNNLDKCGNTLYKPFMCRHCKLTCKLCYDPQCP